jgi:hypothetical protein
MRPTDQMMMLTTAKQRSPTSGRALVRRSLLRKVLAAGIGFSWSALVFAHHGWSEYDATKPLKVTGRVSESAYEHPHGYIRLQADGRNWFAVLAPPSRMESRGLAKTAIAPGATVTVEGYPHRSKSDEMRVERITAEGKTVELR